MTDPTAALVQMTEKAWTAWLDAFDSGLDVVLKSPAFVWGVGRGLDLRHKVRARRDEAAEKALAEARVASKGDLERLAADVHRLDAKLNEVLLCLEEQAVRPAAVTPPPSPAADELAALQARVAELLARVEAQAAAPTQPTATVEPAAAPAKPAPAKRARRKGA